MKDQLSGGNMNVRIGTLTKFYCGASSVQEVEKGETRGRNGELVELTYLELESLQDTMDKKYKTDRHFISYNFEDQENVCRVNKVALSSFEKKKVPITQVLICLDIDHDNHASWDEIGEDPDDHFSAFIEWADESCPAASQWAYWYSTKGGFRVVYVLDTPIPVLECEKNTKWLIRQLFEAGFTVDESTYDWTRLFRLPCVNRDGKRTEDQNYFRIYDQDQMLDVSLLGEEEGTNTNEYGEIEQYHGDMPDPEECRSLLYKQGAFGKQGPTPFLKKFKSLTHDRDNYQDVYDVVLNEKPIDASNGRDNALMNLIGKTISLMRYHASDITNPEAIYALFNSAVEQLIPDSQTPNWMASAWDKTKRLYSLELAKTKKIEDEITETAEDRVSSLEELCIKIINQGNQYHFLAKWAEEFEAEEAEDKIRGFIERRLILKSNSQYFVMAPNGFYDPEFVSKECLPNKIRDIGTFFFSKDERATLLTRHTFS